MFSLLHLVSVPAAIVTQQRQAATVVPTQAISIAKVYPQSAGDNQIGTTAGTGASTNVYIHTPIQATTAATARRSSSSKFKNVKASNL